MSAPTAATPPAPRPGTSSGTSSGTTAGTTASSTTGTGSGTGSRAVLAAALADVAGVVVFAAVGRSSHAEGLTPGGVATTAWPFLVGAGAGWALARAPRRPLALRTGAAVVAGAVVVGMGLRVLVGQGTAVSFVVVTAVVLSALLLGWRALAGPALRRAGRRRG